MQRRLMLLSQHTPPNPQHLRAQLLCLAVTALEKVHPTKTVHPLQRSWMLGAQENWHTGTIRETFFVNQISQHHDILAPDRGDFLVDETWTIEVGRQNKVHCQIAGIDNAYIAADDIETGQDQRVPLWLFGFLA